MLTPNPTLIDIKAAAEVLGTSVRHLRRLIAEHRIAYIKIGHLVRFDLDELHAWINANRHQPNDGAI